MSEVRRSTRTSKVDVWEWTEHWGPQIGDQTSWSVSSSGRRITIRRNLVDIDMSAEVAEKVRDALIEALGQESSNG